MEWSHSRIVYKYLLWVPGSPFDVQELAVSHSVSDEWQENYISATQRSQPGTWSRVSVYHCCRRGHPLELHIIITTRSAPEQHFAWCVQRVAFPVPDECVRLPCYRQVCREIQARLSVTSVMKHNVTLMCYRRSTSYACVRCKLFCFDLHVYY